MLDIKQACKNEFINNHCSSAKYLRSSSEGNFRKTLRLLGCKSTIFQEKKAARKTDYSILVRNLGDVPWERCRVAGYPAEELYVQRSVLAELSKVLTGSFILLLSTSVTRE